MVGWFSGSGDGGDVAGVTTSQLGATGLESYFLLAEDKTCSITK